MTAKVLYIPVEGAPEVREVEPKLEPLQALVGGLIEPTGIPGFKGLLLVVNEEGIIYNLLYNPRATLLAGPDQYIRGPAFVCRSKVLDNKDASLTDAEVKELLGRIA
ncbi:MAG: DUF3846 domain-containing protein [Euryarchaeota archaeon]|nr:DUF3846 domain-containing protein [Euryarchaeota archaeon]MDE1836543.1 DUF3846 domain-containing protein [Euryarchaeota archaeon]MDE1879262.1 DUF3846 domain-containing protein [Euryarchaeota archaeon]MDE2044513.1 DUF3846 domain-containing protein [Thermoplasmata archaeon]